MAETGNSILQDHKTNVSTTSAVSIDWSGEGGVQRVYVTAVTSDIYIGFDKVANSDSFRIIAGQQPAEFNFTGSNVKRIYLLSVSGTNEVYVMGVKT
ncbi:MAG: hypothetical protein PHE73_08805 [Sulfurovaceae bacterium]|nr:hypothetical protein [Sulfurovaceae bacterium]